MKSIQFDGESIRAMLNHRKTQTRRLARDGSPPPYKVGERAWVKEALRGYRLHVFECGVDDCSWEADGAHIWTVDKFREPWRWMNRSRLAAMFCPRDLSRMDIEIVALRLERLHAITRADAIKEGCVSVEIYRGRWDHLNGKRAPWASNPLVWVIDFKVIEWRRLGLERGQ